MRILIVPCYNYPNNLSADSIWNITRDWAAAMANLIPDALFYRLVPTLGINRPLYRFTQKGEATSHPRVFDIPVRMIARFDLEELSLETDAYIRFHPLVGDLPVDAVVCTSSIKMLMLRRFFECCGGWVRLPTFIAFDLLARGEGSKEVGHVSEQEILMQAMGQASADLNLYESPKCESTTLEGARKYLSSAQVRDIQKNSMLAYSGFDDAECAPIPVAERDPRFTVVVRGRTTASKHIDTILDLYNTRFAAGHNVRILFTTGNVRVTPQVRELMKKNSSIDFVECDTKSQANELMRRGHAFILASTHELFCVSLWEMFAAGLIGVIKDADWHKGLLPPNYPFVYDKPEEAYAMLCEIQDNYPSGSKSWRGLGIGLLNTMRTAIRLSALLSCCVLKLHRIRWLLVRGFQKCWQAPTAPPGRRARPLPTSVKMLFWVRAS